ncbi:PEGA domain-containing protein [Polyangium jinanense]|uniref:PEGA domain-containing protein n=1 Tax=Polyangium jinanense TaxID=2829994 RepID=A0A9X4AQN3_9BACT|nr:PEGA domain-containing protein [Polyangium jinanense]MDC3954956.1 PEGA domain-containing protein [Polyangium jinanense]MDC3981274.1 PEGA domain-containing protein [Polyangium jinanense]
MNIERPISATRKRAFAVSALLIVSACPGRALGQDQPRDPAAAEALYMSGRKLVNDGNWDEGCAKFQASMELNPAASTLINIAKCREHEGKLAQAVVDYRRALQLNQDTLGEERKKQLEQVAKEGIEALEPRLARVELVVNTRPEGLEVVRDGIRLPLAALGETIPLDPGKHMFEASAPGYEKIEKPVELAEGQKATVELALVPATTTPKKAPSPPDKPKPASGGVPAWAYVAGGLGLAAVGAGVYFRFDQIAAEERIQTNCPGTPPVCDPTKEYRPDEDNARKDRSFYLFVGLTAAGAVGIGAAVFGIARGLSQKKPQAQSMHVVPYVGRGSGGLVLQGAF